MRTVIIFTILDIIFQIRNVTVHMNIDYNNIIVDEERRPLNI